MKAFSKLSTRKKEELLGFLILTAGALLFLSLITHTIEDDYRLGGGISFAIFEFTSDNWIGLVGAAISFALYYLLGLLAFIVPAYAVIMGVRYLFRWNLPRFRKKVLYVFLILSALVLLFSIKYVQYNGEVDYINTPGGAICIGLTSFVIKFFGKVGAFLLFLSTILVLTSLLVEWRPRWWDTKIAKLPDRIWTRFLSIFGIAQIKSKTKTAKARTKSKSKSKSKFSIQSLFNPLISLYSNVKDLSEKKQQMKMMRSMRHKKIRQMAK